MEEDGFGGRAEVQWRQRRDGHAAQRKSVLSSVSQSDQYCCFRYFDYFLLLSLYCDSVLIVFRILSLEKFIALDNFYCKTSKLSFFLSILPFQVAFQRIILIP